MTSVLCGTLLGLTAVSCADKNFDWEEAYRANPEFVYKENFEKEFGVIDPNQSWDFTQTPSSTRANIPGAPDALNDWNSSWYDVDMNTLSTVGSVLKESAGKNIDNRSQGDAFTCSMPATDFTITPIFQGGNANSAVKVHMVVRNKAGKEDDYVIWEKGDHLEKTCYDCNGTGTSSSTSTCPTCNGTGKSSEITGTIGTWDGNVYTIQSNKGNRYLYGNEVSTNAGKFAIIEISKKYYLYSIDNKVFLQLKNNRLTTTTKYQDASVLTYSNKSFLKIGDANINVTESRNIFSTSYSISTDSKTSNTNWTWVGTKNTDTSVQNLINGVINTYKDCENCKGAGTVTGVCASCSGTGWVEANVNISSSQVPGYDGATMGSPWTVPSSKIRANTLTIHKEYFAEGSTIYFYSECNGNKYHSSLPSIDRGDGKGKLPEIIKMGSDKMPNPATLPSGAKSDSDHEFMIIACEAGTDKDCNDVIFLIEGFPKVPIPLNTDATGYYSQISKKEKRYMVEDLGATDASDIDFNDIVMDFTEMITAHHKTEYYGEKDKGKIKSDEVDRMSGSQTVKVRALGGTKDIALYIGSASNWTTSLTPVFKKSTVGNAAKVSGSNITFKGTYGGATTTNPFSNVETTVMYNTNTTKGGDGKYGLSDYLFTVELGNPVDTYNKTSEEFTRKSTAWIPEGTGANNIYVVVENAKKYSSDGVQIVPDEDKQTIISFPANGTVPTMIAVPTDQAWNYERISVFTHDREGSVLQLKNYVQQTTATEGN